MQASGITSLRGIAAVLNARGVRTARGGRWAASQVAAALNMRGVRTARGGRWQATQVGAVLARTAGVKHV